MTPLQRKLDELGRTLGFLAIGVCAVIFVIALIQGRDLFDMFLTAISLAVAAIPEGLAARSNCTGTRCYKNVKDQCHRKEVTCS